MKSTISLRAARLTSLNLRSLKGSMAKSNKIQHCWIFWTKSCSLSFGGTSRNKHTTYVFPQLVATMILLSRVGGYGESNNLQPIWTGWCLGNCRAILVRKRQTKIWYQWCLSKGQISNLWTSRQLMFQALVLHQTKRLTLTINYKLIVWYQSFIFNCFSWVQFHTPHHVKNMQGNFVATVPSSKSFPEGS